VVICTPNYARAVPGALKNLLEWTVGDGGRYGKPVAWLNVAGPAAPTGGADAHASLARVLGYVGAEVVDAARRQIPVMRSQIGRDGLVAARHLFGTPRRDRGARRARRSRLERAALAGRASTHHRGAHRRAHDGRVRGTVTRRDTDSE